MSDLGAIGSNGNETKSLKIGNPQISPSGLGYRGGFTRSIPGIGFPAMRVQSITVGAQRLAWGGEDFTIGGASAPSIRMDASGRFRLLWLLKPGPRSIQVSVVHSINQNPRPSMFIDANPAIGIPLPVEVFAPPGTGPVTIAVLLNITAQGVILVQLRNNLVTTVGFSPCYFSHIKRT